MCTIGRCGRILTKYPILQDKIFDLITDESGQIWDLTALQFLPRLPKLIRWAVFGDSLQLPPYVTKLLRDNAAFFIR